MKIIRVKNGPGGSLYRPNTRKYQQESNETAGRCWDCDIVYVWRSKLGRLRDAHCIHCDGSLQQTVLSALTVGRYELETDAAPHFVEYVVDERCCVTEHRALNADSEDLARRLNAR